MAYPPVPPAPVRTPFGTVKTIVFNAQKKLEEKYSELVMDPIWQRWFARLQMNVDFVESAVANLDQSFLTAVAEAGLANSRRVIAGTGILIDDNGAGSTFEISTAGPFLYPLFPGVLFGGANATSGYSGIFGAQVGSVLGPLCLPVSGFIQNHSRYVASALGQGEYNIVQFVDDSSPERLSPLLTALPEDTGVIRSIAAPTFYSVGNLLGHKKIIPTAAAGGSTWSSEFSPDIDCDLIGNAFAGTVPTVAIGATRYGPFFHGNNAAAAWLLATETDTWFVIPIPGELRKLAFLLANGQPGDGSLVYTLRLNGAPSSITQTVPAGSGGAFDTPWTDFVNTEAIVAGDWITQEFVNNSPTLVSAALRSQCIVFVPTTAGSRMIGAHVGSAFGAGTTNYSTPRCRFFSTTQANQEWPCPRSGIIRKLYAFVSTAGTPLTLTLMLNGVATALTGTASSAA